MNNVLNEVFTSFVNIDNRPVHNKFHQSDTKCAIRFGEIIDNRMHDRTVSRGINRFQIITGLKYGFKSDTMSNSILTGGEGQREQINTQIPSAQKLKLWHLMKFS